VSDVERPNLGCSPLEEAVGEPSGRSPGVEAGHTCHVEPEFLERGFDLLPTPGNELPRGLDHQRLSATYQARGFLSDRARHQNPSGRNQILCSASTDRQASLD